MTITFGSWVIPLIVTAVATAWGWWPERQTGYGADIVGALKLLASLIVTMAAWLVWALVTR